MITITLNPAIDHSVFVEGFSGGAVNRAESSWRQAGGKGVNVSAMLGRHGIPNVATGFLGRANPELFEELFRTLPIADQFVRLPGNTRTGIKIVDTRSQKTTDINFPGLAPSADDADRLLGIVRKLVKPGRWFVVGGSLPMGISSAWFEELLLLIQSGSGLLAVDASGPALASAIRAGADLIKPNHHELAEYLGRDLPDFSSRLAAADEVRAAGVACVILSLGGDGALFLGPGKATIFAEAVPIDVASTVGAGDSLLAGYLAGLAMELDPVETAKLATVFAWSALEDVRRLLPSVKEIERRMALIRVTEIHS